MKKIFLLVATTSLIFANSACTSKKVDEAPDATAEMTGETTDDMAGVTEEDAPAAEKGATAEGETANAAPAEGSGDFNEEDFGSEDVAEAPSDKAVPAEGATKDEAAADSGEPPAEGADLAESTEAPPEGLAANDATSTETPSEAPAETTDSGSLPKDEMNGLSGEAPVAKASIPLRKIETTPWTQNGILLNAVYLARPGDTFKSVSQKVYGDESKVKDLKKANPSIAARSMKVGDKVYYNSPKRPTDSTILLTYYEDNSLAPETYVSQPGDNIRAVSTKLLGDAQSWKEVWATNADVESKGELAEGTRLRYWAGEAAAAPAPDQTMAQNAPPPADKPQDQAAAGAVAGGAMPPPTDQAPPPPMPEEVNGQQASPPPPAEEVAPPEPAVAEAPPPPPAEVAAAGAAPAAATSNPLGDMLGGEDQTTALMVGALLLIAAAALFIVIRKRKSRKNIDFQTATHTQIE